MGDNIRIILSMTQNSLLQSMERRLNEQTDAKDRYGLQIEPSEGAYSLKQSSEIIHGVVRQGHKLLLAGPNASGKTSLIIHLALCLAHGIPWFGRQVQKTSVLLVNLEIEKASYLHRVHRIAEALGVPCESKNLAYVHHRGGNLHPGSFTEELKQLLISAKTDLHKEFHVVVIDPIYKVIGAGGYDEDSNKRVTALIDGLQSISTDGDVTFLLSLAVDNTHSDYQITQELNTGAGQLARDADALLMLWPLEGHTQSYRLKGRLREFPVFAPMSLEFVYPLFEVNEDLDKVPEQGAVARLTTSSIAATLEEEDTSFSSNKIWKLWETHAQEGSMDLTAFAELLHLKAFELRTKIAKMPPHPSRKSLHLRIGVGNRIVAEED
jgi:energy-coupling factor transporter ATP-binding protein EcfA2